MTDQMTQLVYRILSCSYNNSKTTYYYYYYYYYLNNNTE